MPLALSRPPGFSRGVVRLTAVTVASLAATMLGGACGGPGSPADPQVRVPPMSAKADRSAALAAAWLTTALAAGHVSVAPAVQTRRERCPMASRRAVSAVITARSARKITLRGMREEVDVILRSAGWQVAAVPFSKVPAIGPMRWHPIDDIAKGVLRGAVNILPDRTVGAYALIFINSGCLSR